MPGDDKRKKQKKPPFRFRRKYPPFTVRLSSLNISWTSRGVSARNPLKSASNGKDGARAIKKSILNAQRKRSKVCDRQL